jgi:hypothetical protein
VHPGELPGQVARPVGTVRRDKGFGERLPPGLPVGPALHSTGADQRRTRSGIFRLQQRPASLRNVQTGTVDGTGALVFILFLIVFLADCMCLGRRRESIKIRTSRPPLGERVAHERRQKQDSTLPTERQGRRSGNSRGRDSDHRLYVVQDRVRRRRHLQRPESRQRAVRRSGGLPVRDIQVDAEK